jgi:hypothetical protein
MSRAGRRRKLSVSEGRGYQEGSERERTPEFKEMDTFRCDGCGEEFIVFHHPAFMDRTVAERQAHWLERVLDEEHEREQKHPDRILLPH